jgi:uncharacterized repeat protein (TIGR03803 family)
MKVKRPLVLVFSLLVFSLVWLLLASSAFAASNEPVPVYTFTCTGNAVLRLGSCPSGGRPESLILGSDGNFYGAAQASVEGGNDPTGGVVFSLTPAGTLTVLHAFVLGPSRTYANGNLPTLLTQGPDGRLYGYTIFGGLDGCNGDCGNGVLYRLNTDGSDFKVLYKFCTDTACGDLRQTPSSLFAGTDGNVYGLMVPGAASSYASIFRITPSTGAFATVVNFESSTLGAGFPPGLTLAPDGTFYGIAIGTAPAIVFHFTPSTGTLTTVAVNFPVFDGFLPSGPVSGLTLGPNGNLYGLYSVYGENGTGLFEVQSDGSNLQLFPFYIDGSDVVPVSGLLLASDGNFWGAVQYGNGGPGDIFTLSPTDGTLIQELTPFSTSSTVGAYPTELIQAPDGTLWGSTYQYGKASTGHFGDGTVFSLNAGLPPR